MANTSSAAKNARKAQRRHTLRVAVKSELKTLRKKTLETAETGKGNLAEIANNAYSRIAKAGSNGYIHPRTAARKIGRLMRAVNKLQTTKSA
ncbi:MAG TPA: 30S ribosomal protein S20 [Candidatus Ozemobacteraceae bacterium]|nr:30S ribosomal protein S20 [Candidatus Ozemobacteraceae bacterium]